MAIDRGTYHDLLQRQRAATPPKVVYKTAEVSTVWQKFEGWLTDQIEPTERALAEQRAASLSHPSFSHEVLAKDKATASVLAAQLDILRQVKAQLQSYRELPYEEPSIGKAV